MDDFFKSISDAVKSTTSSGAKFKGQGHKLGGATGSGSSCGTSSQGPGRSAKPAHSERQQQEQNAKRQQEDWKKAQQERWSQGQAGQPSPSTTAPPAQPPARPPPATTTAPPSRASAPPPSSSAAERFPSLPSPFDPSQTVSPAPSPLPPSPGPPTAPTDSEGFNPYQPVFGSRPRPMPTQGAAAQQRGGAGAGGAGVGAPVECPVCGGGFKSQDEVAAHVDECLAQGTAGSRIGDGAGAENGERSLSEDSEKNARLEEAHAAVGVFLSGGPASSSVDIVAKILRNVIADPSNDKFRRVRMANPKIAQAVGAAIGGPELLQAVGFTLREEEMGSGQELVAVLEDKSETPVLLIRAALAILDQHQAASASGAAPAGGDQGFSIQWGGGGGVAHQEAQPAPRPPPVRVPDRQIQVFLPSETGLPASRIEVPPSFFVRTGGEIKAEADARRKKLEESQVLITRAYRQKMAEANKRRYNATILRVQFPDNVVLQGVFAPGETTAAIYEFVEAGLKYPMSDFALLFPFPAANRSPVIPSGREPEGGGAPPPTLESVELVPAALIKFRPGTLPYAGLKNELLLHARELTSVPLPDALPKENGK